MAKIWTQTHSGKAWNTLDPEPMDVHLRDIAVSLSRQCRFNGHCRRFYSVAEHCIHITGAIYDETGDGRLALYGLLHDAAEAYIGDIVQPLKGQLPAIKSIERINLRAILTGLGIDWTHYVLHEATIIDYDLRMLATEKRDLMAPEPRPWRSLPDPFVIKLSECEPSMDNIAKLFISQYHVYRRIAEEQEKNG